MLAAVLSLGMTVTQPASMMAAPGTVAGAIENAENTAADAVENIEGFASGDGEGTIIFENLDEAPWVPEDAFDGEDESATGADYTSKSYVPEGIAGGTDANYNTRAKNQGAYVLTVSADGTVTKRTKAYLNETCWSFGSLSAFEANANLKAGRQGAALDSPDLSERALVYFTYNNDFGSSDLAQRDPLRTEKKTYGPLMKDKNYLTIAVSSTSDEAKVPATIEQDFAFGGAPQFAMDTLALGVGPSDESLAPYSESVSTNSSDPALKRNLEAVASTAKFASDYYLTSGRYIDMAQKDLVKKMVLKYGSVVSTFYYESASMVSGNVIRNGVSHKEYLYNKETQSTNHTLVIVGWDDELAWTVKGSDGTETTITGAWLCKNSYGEDWTIDGLKCPSDNGYFWVSYKTTDKKTSNSSGVTTRKGYTFEVEKKDDGAGIVSNRQYQYDGSAFNAEMTQGISYANIYTAADTTGTANSEYLRSVMVKMATPGSIYSVQLYENPGLNTKKKFDPTTGTPLLAKPVWGEVEAAGYYTLDLGRGVKVKSGSKVAVVVNLYRKKVTDDEPAIFGGISGSYKMTVLPDGKVIKANSKLSSGTECTIGFFKCANSSAKECSYYLTSDGLWHDFYSESTGAPRIKLRTVLSSADEAYVSPSSDEVIEHYEKSPAKPELPDEPLISIVSEKKQSGSTRIYVGQHARITVPDGESDAVWTSSKPQYVTVDDNGYVTGIKKGKSVITARVDGVEYKHTVVVRNPFMVSKTIRSNVTENWTPLINGGKFQTKEWTSSKPAVVEIDPVTGRYKALKRGTSIITVTMPSNRLRTKVIVPALKLKRNKMVMAPEADERQILFTTTLFSDPTFESSDENVATVDEEGVVHAEGNGKAIITVTVEGTTLRCKITVKGFEVE